VLLQELLVLALQVLLEDDAPDVEAAVLVSEACLLLPVRRIEVRIVVDFAGPADTGVERLRGLVVALQGVGIEQVTALLREDYTALVAAEIDGLDEPLGAEMAEGVVVDVEVLFGHDAEGAHRGKCSAVLAIQLVHVVAVDDQFARVVTRQVKIVHQSVAWVVVGSVTLVVHARTPIVVFAQVVPSGIVHMPSPCCSLLGECA